VLRVLFAKMPQALYPRPHRPNRYSSSPITGVMSVTLSLATCERIPHLDIETAPAAVELKLTAPFTDRRCREVGYAAPVPINQLLPPSIKSPMDG